MTVTKIINRLFLALENPKWFFFAAIVFWVFLELSYRKFVNPVFEYSGFILDVNAVKYVEAWLLYAVLLLLFPKNLNKASDYLMAYMLFSFLTPLLVFYSLTNASRSHLYIVLLAVALIVGLRTGRPLKLPLIRGGRIIAFGMLGLGIVLVTSWMVLSGGLNYFNLDLTQVYDVRRDVGEAINYGPMGYFNIWATKVFGPVVLAFALWKRKYLLAIAVFALHVVWFGISSHKSVLFYPFLVVFLWAWFRRSRALALLPMAMSLLLAVSFLFYLLFSDILLGSLFIRRVFFVPANLTFSYYEFFSHNQFVYWSNSITSSFIEYPYDMQPAKMIGNYIGTESHANNSFLSTGYMHAGVLGVAFYGGVIGLLFRLVDSLAYKGIPGWVAVSAIIVPAHSLLTSVDLPTALATHGLGIAIVLLFLLRSANDKRKVKAAVAGVKRAIQPLLSS